jgi:crotonobetainyl-CoA:carnitine CoA-transferase CaiB-like acyl-CoA transferase
MIVAANNDALWRATAKAMGQPQWTEDPRFETVGLRLEHRIELVETIEAVTRTGPTDRWLEALTAAGVPAGPVNDYPQVFDDPQAQARDMVLETEHPQAGTIKMIGSPLKLSEMPSGVRRRPPLLGEHTAEVLSEIGLDAEAVARLSEPRGATR